ncbi:MAG: efflux RND transporter periplasmic adaptor subunit [Bacteroidaceae bacterium]|nr:efflux RND transporter periplasmic adaptor subunit [Bacteroidaceae bacterium]
MKTKWLLAALITFTFLSCSHKQETRQKTAIRVKTAISTHAEVKEGVQYVGIVEENEATAVSFTGMGVVRRILVTEGQTVARGQLLAELDDTQARNLLEGAQASVNQAEDALQRYQLLHDRGSLTEAQWVEIQSKVTQARSQLAVARKNLADCQLKSPVAGIIGRKAVGAGETAMPSQAIVTILDISSVKVKFSVPEREMNTIHSHTPTTIHVDAIQRTFEGGTIEKGIQADAITHTYDVRVRVNNRDRKILPGMVATVNVNGRRADSFPSNKTGRQWIPITAVQRNANGSLFTWTISNDSTAHRTPVTLGETDGNDVEVLTGLSNGQRFVIEGYQKLSEGTKVIF